MSNELITKENTQLIQQQAEAVNNTIQGTFYNTGKKQVPDSRVIQSLANKFRIKTIEVLTEQTNDYAKAVVGAESPNGVYMEDVVIHHFPTIMQKKIVELFEKELSAKKDFDSKPMNKEKQFKPVFFNDIADPFSLEHNGTIIPNLTLKGQVKIFKDMTRFKDFSVRDAYSKAANRVQRRLLNQEFREDIEIDLEDEEVRNVNNNKKVTKNPVEYTKKKKKAVNKFNEDVKKAEDSLKTERNNNPVTEAVQDYDKRKSKRFNTADKVEKTSFTDDPDARAYLKQIIFSLKEEKIAVNETSIKKYIADCVKDEESGITLKEASQAIKELEKTDLKKLI